MSTYDIGVNLAHLIVADCDEELNRVHSDGAEAEIETIERVKFKATKIIVCLEGATITLDERDALLVALEQIACLDEEHTRAKEAINDALGIARAALAKTRNEEA